MEVTSEATDENNEVDLTSQECTADTNNMNETNDIQNEETEQSTFSILLSIYSVYYYILCQLDSILKSPSASHGHKFLLLYLFFY